MSSFNAKAKSDFVRNKARIAKLQAEIDRLAAGPGKHGPSAQGHRVTGEETVARLGMIGRKLARREIGFRIEGEDCRSMIFALAERDGEEVELCDEVGFGHESGSHQWKECGHRPISPPAQFPATPLFSISRVSG